MVETDLTETDQDAANAAYAAFRARAQGTNVHPDTLLATDYLNHFNEVVMLIDMVPDMPEILEECRAWEPKAYEDHFRDSSIADKDLAIEAYAAVPPDIKSTFEGAVMELEATILDTIDSLQEVADAGETDRLADEAAMASQSIQMLMDRVGGIINGRSDKLAQDDIDALMAD